MENIEKILDKLMLNRTKLMLARFDKELKVIIEQDLQSFKATANNQQLGNREASSKEMMVA